jgi:hypothetical protein
VIGEGNRLLPTPLRFSSSSIRRLPRLRSFPPESFLANPCCLRGELTTGRRNPRSGSLSRGGWISAAPLVILRGELLGLSRFLDVRRGEFPMSDVGGGISGAFFFLCASIPSLVHPQLCFSWYGGSLRLFA